MKHGSFFLLLTWFYPAAFSMIPAFGELPHHIKETIIFSIPSSQTSLEENIKNIKSLCCLTKEFSYHIRRHTPSLLQYLVCKHNTHFLEIARLFKTLECKKWLKNYEEGLHKKIIEKPSVHDIPDLMTLLVFKAIHTLRPIFVPFDRFYFLHNLLSHTVNLEKVRWHWGCSLTDKSIATFQIHDVQNSIDLQFLENRCKSLLTTLRSNWKIKSSSACKEINNKRLKRSGFQLNKRLLAYEANLLETLLSIFTLKPRLSFPCYDENNNNEIEYSIEYDDKIEKILDLQIISS